MGIDIEPIRTASLSVQISDKIRQAIVNGDLKADERLPTEEELAQRFEVSRPTIREALKRLAAQNLVRSRRGPSGGTFVNRPSASEISRNLTSVMTLLVGMGEFELDEIDQARRELETTCCRLAALHRNGENLKEMAKELAIQRDPGLSAEEFCASDVRFHRCIAEATQNGVLRFVMSAVLEALQPIANMISYRHREREVIVDQHQRLLAALDNRDGEQAVRVIGEQMDYLSEQERQAKAARAAR